MQKYKNILNAGVLRTGNQLYLYLCQLNNTGE